MMVAYHYDTNVIRIKPLKTRQAETIVDAWTRINDTFAALGTQPNIYILDDEFSEDLKAVFGKNGISFQRVLPTCHCANSAERVIQTTKSRFKVVLVMADPNFPIQE